MADTDRTEPRVSVVMPVFNGETYLVEAIESVLGQTLEELELVLVDDASRDGSRAIAERFAREDTRVKVVANERNVGIAAALNRGWRAARSPFIARLDADDIALPDRLARQADFLDAHPCVAAVGGAAITIDAAGRRGSTLRFPTESRRIRSTLLRHNCFAHPSVVLRRDALEQVGGYRFDHAEDYDLWLRLSERFELANLAEAVILYRQHAGQFTFVALEEQAIGPLAVRAAARSRLASGEDPLAGVEKLSREILGRLGIDEAEIAGAIEQEWLGRAAILDDLGHLDEVQALIAKASEVVGRRAPRAFIAARELKRADTLLGSGRPLAGVGHVFLAFRSEPRYALSRVTAWLGDRLRGRWVPTRT
jgi:hypothetical protein